MKGISVENLKSILNDFKSRILSSVTTTKTELENQINKIDTSNFMDKNTYDVDSDGDSKWYYDIDSDLWSY